MYVLAVEVDLWVYLRTSCQGTSVDDTVSIIKSRMLTGECIIAEERLDGIGSKARQARCFEWWWWWWWWI